MSRRPNILWYCTDQQRFDTIGALGNPYVSTPTLDKLVNEGTVFTHSYCQSPICTPSRSSFMTGMYPGRIHNCRNGNESFKNPPPLISKLLADSGYDCGLVGKFHLQSAGKRTEPRLDDGYRYWRFSHAPRDDWSEGHHYGDWIRDKGGDLDALRKSSDRVPSELHQTTWVSECALEFINHPRDPDVPWMLTLNPYSPHEPLIPPRSYAEMFDASEMPGPHFEEDDLVHQNYLREIFFQSEAKHPDVFDGKKQQALYYAMIRQIDDQFARILYELERTKQRENTVIIFTSDHGECLGDHGLLWKGCRFYEGLVRVPLIFSCPGHIPNLRSDALVELIDMSATILDLGKVNIPGSFQGHSLLPIMSGQADPGIHRSFVRSEYYDAIDTEPLTYATMYRNERYKLVMYHTHEKGELFDLELDPWEHKNLWDDQYSKEIKLLLIEAAFNSTMVQDIDVGSERIFST